MPSTPATLFVVAAPTEAWAVARAFDPSRFADKSSCPVAWRAIMLAPDLDMVVTGVGKANAAAALARVFDPARHSRVLNLGVAGALPRSKLILGDILIADPSVYADEGVRTPDRFIDIAACGFAPNQNMLAKAASGGVGQAGGARDAEDAGSAGPTGRGDPEERPTVAATPDPALRDQLAALLGARVGPIATVSTCSGRNGLALRVVEQTGAIAEAMEGAAAAFTLHRLAREANAAPAFAEVRVISNTTGNRARQRWDLTGALGVLGTVARSIAQVDAP